MLLPQEPRGSFREVTRIRVLGNENRERAAELLVAAQRRPAAAPADPRARLGAGAAAVARGAARAARPRARRARPRGRGRARPRRSCGVVPRRGHVALLPSRGVAGTPGSSRRRTSSASARERSTCSRRRARLRVGGGARRGDAARSTPGRRRSASAGRSRASRLAETLALAGYERVERAEDRGQFAVRGGLVDVFPTTGREPLRVEFFGDEIEQVRAFSPFTQRALHPVEEAVVYAASERRLDLVEPDAGRRRRGRADGTEGLVPRPPGGPDLVWERAEVLQVWEEEGLEPIGLSGASELDQLPPGQPFSFEAQRPALAARGLSEAENEVDGVRARRPSRRRRVPAPRRRAPHGEPAAPRRCAAARAGRGAVGGAGGALRRLAGASRLRLARPEPRPAPGHAGLSQARAQVGHRAHRPRAAVVRRPADRRLRRARGPRHRQAPRLRDEGRSPASRATTCCSRSAATTGSTSRTSRSARCRATSAPTHALPRCRSSAARPGRTSRRARAVGARARGRAARAVRATAAGAGRRVRPSTRMAAAAGGGVPLPRDAGPGARDRGR